jgi:hypothetical protein
MNLFFNRREVKRSKYAHSCAFCHEPIAGAHVRFWVIDGHLGIDRREHYECEKTRKAEVKK